MGATRKLLSICTGGIIDYRSDKERTARSARRTAKETKRLRKAQQATARTAGAQGWPQPADVPTFAPPRPAGWYPDPGRPGSGQWRWWDGQQWTGTTRWNTGRVDASGTPETVQESDLDWRQL